jgi:hypothetical protein
MATERTPPHKRIARAEKAREEWKQKAVRRREENQQLKLELKEKNLRLDYSKKENKELKKKLIAAENRNSKYEKMINEFKKKNT